MLTILLLILIVLLLGGGYYGRSRHGARGLVWVVILALVVLMLVWTISDEIAVGPGVPSIMAPPE